MGGAGALEFPEDTAVEAVNVGKTLLTQNPAALSVSG